MGHRLNLKWLRHFAHPTLIFTGGGGKKSKIWPRSLTPVAFVHALLQKWKQRIWKLEHQWTVMSKYQIECYCQISNHLINRFKSFGQISNPIFSSNLKVTNFKSLIFVLSLTLLFTYFPHQIQSVLNCMRTISAATVRDAVSPALGARVLHRVKFFPATLPPDLPANLKF